MSLTATRPPAAPPARKGAPRRRPRKVFGSEHRTVVSPHHLNTVWGRRIYWAVLVFVLVTFTLVFLFPLYWMVTGAMKTQEEFLRLPPTYFPSDWTLESYRQAWELMGLGKFLLNTFQYAFGALAFTLAFDVAAAYALSKLRPVFGNVVLLAMLATLMIPPTVILLPAYLTVKDLPLVQLDLLNTPWAIWLPTVANGFTVFLLKRFFDGIPRELIEAAQIDGASPFRILRSIVLPVSRPILGVVSILTVTNVWRDFVWPLLVLPDPERMTISVGIASLRFNMPQTTMTAALVIASIPTIVVFLAFQRHIMAGLTAGGLKG
ncbi:carbohydrate ABC transporter membrane protein 2 (CUT1 family) [Actinocorallia herbida]|uniref:Carbohydrate ABC transporter membrane protein 2 (CUT1 family) n=1 Tax=Actinocorallia herbida TaxID=58109 RepID=A0A3N1CSI4_9ACTN|nr:carbohydrate ABC transporter permease [Actinocorallia herbida]ROO84270.1 carbohydrate ABC transporter membrane protein 2 (CUT1 family) [Actinocorallia herbida]